MSDSKSDSEQVSKSKQDWPDWLPHILCFKRKCPRCNSVKFKQAEMRSIDELLAMFAVRPVRCIFCWRRYYWISLRGAPAQ